MRKFKSIMMLLLVAVMLVAAISPAAMAADVANATIDTTKTASLTIWKYDFTNAKKDGVWDEDSFVSTGYRESYVEDILGSATRKGDTDKSSTLGNGDSSNGYAIKGVEFTYLKVAEIAQYTQVVDNTATALVVYGFNKTASADLLSAIGLADGANHYEPADSNEDLSSDCYWYTSDVINNALTSALEANSTTVKNALEKYVAAQGGTAMDLTDENGKTIKKNLPLGLYLLVETKVPEMVTSTVNPFFVSLPMTTVTGGTDGEGANSSSPEGGHEWNYDVVVYPKDETGLVTLEKTVRESAADGGHNNGSDSIDDGYAHTATASAGDVMEYQIISGIPTITSDATAISCWNFFDTLSEGLSYQKANKDVKIEIFTDADCTQENKVASWDQSSGMFTVNYSDDDRTMTVDVTAAGLAEMNDNTYENINGELYVGYSNYTMRLTYTAKINSAKALTLGDNGNDNKVVLTWKRTSAVSNGTTTDYYDTLIDDAHVYTFGIDLTKTFKDKDSDTAATDGMFDHVKFKLYNNTDGYYVKAERNETDGVYYVTGRTTSETDATTFYPMEYNGVEGSIVVWGMEDDEYILTEVETANGYSLLKETIHVTLTTSETEESCDIYDEDTLGLVQNDDRYSFGDVPLAYIAQTQLEHKLLTVSATVRTDSATTAANAKMGDDEVHDSSNALAKLTVVNTPGVDLPATGETGTWMYGVFGIGIMVMAAFIIFFLLRKRDEDKEAA